MKNLTFSLLLSILFLVACGEKSVSPTHEGSCLHDFSLQKDAQTTINNDINVKLIDITDSRCPVNANCIRMGEAQATFRISQGGKTSDVTLCIGECNGRNKNTDTTTVSVNNHSYRLILKEIQPYPTTEPTGNPKTASVQLKTCDVKD
jgi:hypothetical protein